MYAHSHSVQIRARARELSRLEMCMKSYSYPYDLLPNTVVASLALIASSPLGARAHTFETGYGHVCSANSKFLSHKVYKF